jgi:hypothetical protein
VMIAIERRRFKGLGLHEHLLKKLDDDSNEDTAKGKHSSLWIF